MADLSFNMQAPLDLQVDFARIQRQQALAQALQQSAMTPDPSVQAGTYMVRQSPLQPLAKMLQAYMAGGLQHRADLEASQLGQLATARQMDMASTPPGGIPTYTNSQRALQAFPQAQQPDPNAGPLQRLGNALSNWTQPRTPLYVQNMRAMIGAPAGAPAGSPMPASAGDAGAPNVPTINVTAKPPNIFDDTPHTNAAVLEIQKRAAMGMPYPKEVADGMLAAARAQDPTPSPVAALINEREKFSRGSPEWNAYTAQIEGRKAEMTRQGAGVVTNNSDPAHPVTYLGTVPNVENGGLGITAGGSIYRAPNAELIPATKANEAGQMEDAKALAQFADSMHEVRGPDGAPVYKMGSAILKQSGYQFDGQRWTMGAGKAPASAPSSAPATGAPAATPASGSPSGGVVGRPVGGAVAAGQSTQGAAYAGAEGQSAAKYREDLNARANTANQRLMVLQEMENLTKGMKTGALAPFKEKLGPWMQAFGMDPDKVESLLGVKIGDAQAMHKLSAAFAGVMAKDLTARPTQSEFQTFLKTASPNISQTPEGLHRIIDWAKFSGTAPLEELSAYNKWLAGGGKPENSLDFKRQFEQSFTPEYQRRIQMLNGSAKPPAGFTQYGPGTAFADAPRGIWYRKGPGGVEAYDNARKAWVKQ